MKSSQHGSRHASILLDQCSADSLVTERSLDNDDKLERLEEEERRRRRVDFEMSEDLEKLLRAKQTETAKEVMAGSLGTRTPSNRSAGSQLSGEAEAELNLDLANIESNRSSNSAGSQAPGVTDRDFNRIDLALARRGSGLDPRAYAEMLQDFKSPRDGEDEQIIRQIADELVQKLERSKSKREFVLRKKTQKLLGGTEPVYAYFSECIKQAALDVPVFEFLRDSWLVIRQQKLSTGHCLAILRGCATAQARTTVDSVTLNDTELTDQ